MVIVCKDHVIRGLRLLSVPHINEILVHDNKNCTFCEQLATFKLYFSDRTTHFIIQKKERQKKHSVSHAHSIKSVRA